MILYYSDPYNKQHVSSIVQKCQDDTRYSLQETQARPPSRYSHNNRRACLRSCSKEGFKAVSISITNISCEI